MMRHRDHLELDIKATLISVGLSIVSFGAIYTPLHLGNINESWSLAIAAIVAIPITIIGRWSFVVTDRLARYGSRRDEFLEQLMKSELTIDEIERLIDSLDALPEDEQRERERDLVALIEVADAAHRDVKRAADELFALHQPTPAQRTAWRIFHIRHRYRIFLFERSRQHPSWLLGHSARSSTTGIRSQS